MKTLQMQELIHEQSKTNIDNFFYVVLEKMRKILFASERSGWAVTLPARHRIERNHSFGGR